MNLPALAIPDGSLKNDSRGRNAAWLCGRVILGSFWIEKYRKMACSASMVEQRGQVPSFYVKTLQLSGKMATELTITLPDLLDPGPSECF